MRIAGAELTAEEAREGVAARGRFVVAFSGGRTPWTHIPEANPCA
jgi:6-phosphogluconolactonase/glucosamine-6-phosphate isomerase/deaminase